MPDSFYANNLKGVFGGFPAIIVGAGPSLEYCIEDLKELKNRAFIIAGGSAVSALSKWGIEPHLIVAVDPNEEGRERFKKNYFFEVPLIYSLRTFPEVLTLSNPRLGYLRSFLSNDLYSDFEEILRIK